MKDLGNPSFQLLGELSRLRPRAEAVEGFSGKSPQGSKDGCDDLQQPHLSQRLEVGISSHQLQPHMARRPVSAALWCVRTSPFSGGPHLLKAPDSCLGSQLLCKKWAQSNSELLWFLNCPRFLSHLVLLLAQLCSAASYLPSDCLNMVPAEGLSIMKQCHEPIGYI